MSETPSIATYRKKMFGRKYVKTTMRMLTILREAEEWTCMHLREASLLVVRECNYEKLTLLTSKRQSACTSNNFTFARPLMGTIFLVIILGWLRWLLPNPEGPLSDRMLSSAISSANKEVKDLVVRETDAPINSITRKRGQCLSYTDKQNLRIAKREANLRHKHYKVFQ